MTTTQNMTPLRQLREEIKLTQEQLAVTCGTTRDRISIWERAMQTPTLDLQISLAKAFNMPLVELQKRCNWPQRTDIVLVGLEGGKA